VTVGGASLPPSPSSGRLVGDDVQHLIAWYWCLKACAPESGIASVEVEVESAGILDDVRVTFTDHRQRYMQVKATVSAVPVANVGWLTKQEPAGSLIQRLYKSWWDLGRPATGVELLTSRPIDSRDLLFRNLDRLEHLGPRLRRVTEPAMVEVRTLLAHHVGCSAEELCDFLDVLEIQLGQTEGLWRKKVDDAALAAGVRTGDEAAALGVTEVREWVKTTRSARSASELRARVDALGLRTETPRALVVVEAVDAVPAAADAAVHLNWVHHFRGDSDRTRRGLFNPEGWNGQLAAELRAARRQLQEAGVSSVAVRGALRLPVWFAVGEAFSDVAGFNVAAMDDRMLWQPGPAPTGRRQVVRQSDEALGGPDVDAGVVVQISTTGVDDVRDDLGGRLGRLIAVTVEGGPHRRLLQDGADAFAAAVAVRDWMRHTLRGHHVHLVLVTNGPFALFLGHLWDRMPSTTVYEDLAPGYEPAFQFRNAPGSEPGSASGTWPTTT
jgi:hypothetical protein